VKECCNKIWNEQADYARQIFMFISFANGEILAGALGALKTIPSEAMGNVISTIEPLESRLTSSVNSNSAHERPAPQWGEDVLRSSEKFESWDKEPSEKAAHA
jgi:hypothetical protein